MPVAACPQRRSRFHTLLTRALALRALLFDEGLDLPVTPFGGRAWLRLSAQVYNTLDDYAEAASIVARVIPGVAIQPNAR